MARVDAKTPAADDGDVGSGGGRPQAEEEQPSGQCVRTDAKQSCNVSCVQ